MNNQSNSLVYAALLALVLVIFIGAIVISKSPESSDIEISRLRFAAATFAGITMLFVFVSILYFVGDMDSPGQQIFDKGFTAMFTLAGTILGYLFGSDRFGHNQHDRQANISDARRRGPNGALHAGGPPPFSSSVRDGGR